MTALLFIICLLQLVLNPALTLDTFLLVMLVLRAQHGSLNKSYRDLVETLFRGKHLKAVLCTSTLAVGISMPARTSVFCGDSKFLTPLQYRQMAGRAGRRGYDNIGCE